MRPDVHPIENSCVLLSEHALGRLVEFTRMLRTNGFQVGIGEAADAAKVAELCSLTDGRRLRWGLRSLVCNRLTDWQRFDELFDAYWYRTGLKSAVELAGQGGKENQGLLQHSGAARGTAIESADAAAVPDEAQRDGRHGRASPRESLARRDFRQFTDAQQMQALQALVERLAKRMGRRLAARRRDRSEGRLISYRRTVRNSLRYGGMPFELAYRKRVPRSPRLVLMLDVSGSMNLYSLLFLRFARGLVEVFSKARAFVFHTRLIHVTEMLRDSDLHRAAERLELVSTGWSGGTRIGDALEALRHHHSGRVLASRPILIIVSDGLDTGAPEKLGSALSWLKRRVRRVVWLNPLLGRDGYQPSARGMNAALPYLDVFAPAHNLASLLALEHVLARL